MGEDKMELQSRGRGREMKPSRYWNDKVSSVPQLANDVGCPSPEEGLSTSQARPRPLFASV